jgi:hypothetical protein
MAPQPAEVLLAPVATQPFPSIAELLVSGPGRLTSPSEFFSSIIQSATGTDPWAYAVERLAGSWEAVAVGASALEHLAEFNDAFAAAVDERVTATVPTDWEGRAATAAAQYFTGLVETLRSQAGEIRALAREFNQVALGMQLDAEAVEGLLHTITDIALIAVVSAAAAAVVPLSLALTIAAIGAIARVWITALETFDHAWSIVQAFTAFVAVATAELDATGDHPLPAGAYDHPGT